MRRVRLSDAKFEYDPGDPEGFRSGMARFGRDFGAQDSGATLYELKPGEAVCPYHYEYGEEEWAMALDGAVTLRTPAGTEPLEPFEVVFFPKGPAGAHQILNDTDSTVRVLMWSAVVYPTATAYPDSDKVGVYTGDRSEDVIVERSSSVPYFQGESRS